LAAMRDKDPLKILHKYVIAHEITTPTHLEEIDGETTSAVSAAVEFARESPEPETESIYEDTWV
ncbi:MAG: hypothetical protein AAFV33_29765, partial [Chloroflexota bacterium]